MQSLFDETVGEFPVTWSEFQATNTVNNPFARRGLSRRFHDPAFCLPSSASEHFLSDFEPRDEGLFHGRSSRMNFLSQQDYPQDFNTNMALSGHRRTMKQVYENDLLEKFNEGYSLGMGINQCDFQKGSATSGNQFSRESTSISIEKQDTEQSEIETSTEQRPTRKKGWRKPPDMPKRPMSSYNLFFQLERERLINDMPDKVYTESDVNRIAAICKLKEIYSGQQQQKRKHRKTHGKISFATLARVTANKWKELPEEQKQPFIQRAIIEKQKYQNAVEAWSKSKMKDTQMEPSKDKVQMELSKDTLAESNSTGNPIANALDEALIISSTAIDTVVANPICEGMTVQRSTPPVDVFTDPKDEETIHVVSPLDKTPEQGDKELKYFSGDIGTSTSLLELLGCSRKRRKTEEYRLNGSPEVHRNQGFIRPHAPRNSDGIQNIYDVYDTLSDEEIEEVDPPPPLKEVAIKTRMLQQELNSAYHGKQRTQSSHQEAFSNAGLAQGFSPSFATLFENDAISDHFEIMENSYPIPQTSRDFRTNEFPNDLPDFPLENYDERLYPSFQAMKGLQPRFKNLSAANRSRPCQPRFASNGSGFNKQQLLAEYYRLKRRNLFDEQLDFDRLQFQRPPMSAHDGMRSSTPRVPNRFDTRHFNCMDQNTIDSIPSNLSGNRGCVVTPSRTPKQLRRSTYMFSPTETEEDFMGQMMQEEMFRRYNGTRGTGFAMLNDDLQMLQEVGGSGDNENHRNDSIHDPVFANDTSNRFDTYSNTEQEFQSFTGVVDVEATPVRNDICCDAGMEVDPNKNSVYEV
jgi:HMG (high mobility group) box